MENICINVWLRPSCSIWVCIGNDSSIEGYVRYEPHNGDLASAGVRVVGTGGGGERDAVISSAET